MKLLYGVQGTGNGHVTRARVLAPVLRKAGIEVQYLFSGRDPSGFFDMEVFGNWWWRRGLTFVSRNGRVDIPRTLLRVADVPGFIRDVATLELSGFDLVLSDFEPVSAWAAQLHGKPLVGMGHQYAFRHRIPKYPGGFLAQCLLRGYAPAPIGLGLHWHHFEQPILPPLVESLPRADVDPGRILVYLPFESLETIASLLRPFRRWRFQIFHGAVAEAYQQEHIEYHPLSRPRFQEALSVAGGVICNCGFELISEALSSGKRILAKPMQGQWEQCSNAVALMRLGWGDVMWRLHPERVQDWLESSGVVQVEYPNVAEAIVAWLLAGEWRIDPDWCRSLWQKTRIRSGDGGVVCDSG